MRRLMMLIAVCALPIVLALAGCERGEQRPLERTQEQSKEERVVPAVRTEPVRSTLLHVPVKTTGEVVLNIERVAQVTSRVSGWVEEVFAFQEDRVQAGKVLARIYSPDYLTAQTELLLAEDRLRRAGEDPEEKRVALAVLEASGNRLRLLGASEERIEALQREHTEEHRVSPYLEIRSPLDGTVFEISLSKGKSVSPGDVLLRIADLSRLWVLADIFERDLARVPQGAEVRVSTPAYPGEVYRGRLVLLSGIQQEKTRTVKARVVVENPKGKLRPGMFADVEVDTVSERAGLVVPEGAVVLLEGEPVVFVEEGKRYHPRAVEAGRRFDGSVEIVKGLKEGERVVVEGAFDLKAALLKERIGEGH